MWSFFIRGLAAAFPAVSTPGPLQACYLAQALALGWRRTVIAAIAPLLSDAPIILLVLLVLTQLPAWGLSLIQIGGGLFVLYLGVSAGRAFWQQEQVGGKNAAADDLVVMTSWQLLGKAVVLNLLNPSPFIFWSTLLGPILIEAWRISPLHGLAFLLGFYGMFILGLALIIILFGKTGQISPRVNWGLRGLSVLALLGFGGYQLGLGVYRLLEFCRY